MARIESGVKFNKNENHKKLAKNMDTTKQYTILIPEHLYKAVRIKLIKEGTKLRPLIIEMLEKYVKV